MKYNEINVGDKASIKHMVTSEDIQQFVKLSGDDNKLHVDAAYAASTSFKKPVAHGMISAAFISTIIGTRLPGDGALWYEQNMEFLMPVRVGDEIEVKAEVTKKIDRLNAIELKTEVFNQHRQKVIDGVARVKIIEENVDEKKAELVSDGVGSTLIIGASGGIGSAVATSLASEGHQGQLILHYNSNRGKTEALKQDLESSFNIQCAVVQADVSDEKQLNDMIYYCLKRYGKVDRLVFAPTSKVVNLPFSQVKWKDVQNHIDIHIKALFNLLKVLVPEMQKAKYGKIVAITTQGIEYPFSDLMPYIVAKSGLHGMIKALAHDLAPKGIRLNMVSPGITDTDLNADLPEKARLIAASKTPLRRLAMPEDVAQAICYLLSEKSDYLAGETIRVNGGQIMI